MPLPMVHLGISNNIVKSDFGINNLPNFYLGAIAPDAIHMRHNAGRFAKNKTHLLQEGKHWKEINEYEHVNFILDFIDRNRKKSSKDFLWGYGVHILTDIFWHKKVYSHFTNKYRKDENHIQEERWAYYNDTDRLDFILYNESPWRESVFKELIAAKAMDFLDLLSADEINAWNDRTLHWYDRECQHKNPIRYISKLDILSFMTEASAIILEKLK